MTATFVGTRSAEDRRRRRLVAAADDVPEVLPTPDGNAAAADDASAAGDERQGRCGHLFPVRKLISPRLWKLWLAAVVVIGGAGGLVYGGWSATRPDTALTDAARRLLELPFGPGVRFLGTILLLATSQLALLIYWVRSRSPRDFEGRYDIWPWSAAAGFVFLVCFSTDAHLVWTEFSQRIWRPNFWNREVLSWFAPVAGAAAVLWGGLHRDMRRCRTSTTFLWLAAGLFLAAGALRLGIGLRSESAANAPAQAGTMLGGCVALFLSLLFHARYVIFVCDEPPERRPSRLRFLTRLRIPGRALVARWAERRRVARADRRAARAADLAARKAAAAAKRTDGDDPQEAPATRRTRTATTRTAARTTSAARRATDADESTKPQMPRVELTKSDPVEAEETAAKTSRSWFGFKRSAPTPTDAKNEEPKPTPAPAPVAARKEPAATPPRPAQPEPATKPAVVTEKPTAEESVPAEKTSRSWFGFKRSAPTPTDAKNEEPKPTPAPVPVAARKEPAATPPRPAQPEPATKPAAEESETAEKASGSWFGSLFSKKSEAEAADDEPQRVEPRTAASKSSSTASATSSGAAAPSTPARSSFATAEPRPAAASSVPPKPQSAPAPAAAADDDDDGDDEDDGDGTQHRVDGAHNREQFKGLSKRERRALRKQLKDERRSSRDAE